MDPLSNSPATKRRSLNIRNYAPEASIRGVAKSNKDKLKSTWVLSKVDAADPKCIMLLSNMILPSRLKSKISNKLPKVILLKADRSRSGRIMDCGNGDEPRCRKSRAKAEESILAIPKTKVMDPRRRNCWGDHEKSTSCVVQHQE